MQIIQNKHHLQKPLIKDDDGIQFVELKKDRNKYWTTIMLFCYIHSMNYYSAIRRNKLLILPEKQVGEVLGGVCVLSSLFSS